jgi:pimeloyl-ACP methyl ester carboxylesterase
VETPPLQRLLGGLSTRTPAVLRGLFRGQAWLASRLDPSFVVDQYTADETTLREETAEIVRRDFCEAFARHRSGAVTDLRNTATPWGIDYETITPGIRMWHGQNDTNVSVGDARRLKEELPGAELRVLEDADHLQTLLETVQDVLETHQEPPS